MQENKSNISTLHGWHLKKEVTIGQIATVVLLLVSGLWWATTVETRMGQLASEDKRIEQRYELQYQNITDRFDRYQATVTSAMNEIKSEIKDGFTRMDIKLDNKQDKTR